MNQVVIYTENYYYGGLERFIADLLKSKEIKFTIVANSCNRRILEIALKNGVEYHPVNLLKIEVCKGYFFSKILNGMLYYASMVPNYFKLRQLFKTLSNKNNLLIINGGYPGALSCEVAAVSAKLAGFSNVAMSILSCPTRRYNNKVFAFLHKFIDFIVNRSVDIFIPNSDAIAKELSYMPKFSADKIHTIYTGVDPLEIISEKVASLAGITKAADEIWIGMIGLLGSTKRQDIVIEAMNTIVSANKSIKCVLVGDGPEKAKYEKMITNLGLDDSIYITGYVDDMRQAYGFIDIMVFLSDQEGLPYTISEAMLNGIPIISSNVGGISEQITNKKGGILLDTNSPIELANKVLALIGQPSILKEYASYSVDTAKRLFLIWKMNQEIYAIFFNRRG